MQIRARIDFKIAKGRNAAIDLCRIGELAGIGHALVIGDRQRGETERGRRKVAAKGQRRRQPEAHDLPGRSHGLEPQQSAQCPQHKWPEDQVRRLQPIHGGKHRQPRETRARQIGEIDPREQVAGAQENRSEEEGARQEGQEIQQEICRQPPLLGRIGNQENGVERNLLGREIAGHSERPEDHEAHSRRLPPMPVEEAGADAHHRTRQPEAEHRKAHHQ